PRACPYETFVDATFSRAYLNFLARICRFRFQGSFEGWLGKVALTAALDERRVLVGRKKTAEEREGAAAHEGESPIGMLGQEEDLFRTQVPRVTLAVEVKDAMAILSETRAAQTPGAETVLAAKERKFLVRELLI